MPGRPGYTGTLGFTIEGSGWYDSMPVNVTYVYYDGSGAQASGGNIPTSILADATGAFSGFVPVPNLLQNEGAGTLGATVTQTKLFRATLQAQRAANFAE